MVYTNYKNVIIFFLLLSSFASADYLNNYDNSTYKDRCVYNLDDSGFNSVSYKLSSDDSSHSDLGSSLDDYIDGYRYIDGDCVKVNLPTASDLNIDEQQYNFLMALSGLLVGSVFLLSSLTLTIWGGKK